MDPSLVNQIIVAAATLLASLGGYLLAGVNERRRDERALERELALRATERVDGLDDASHVFQRETLLALQDAVQVMARLTTKAMHFDHMQARKGNDVPLPDPSDQDLYANMVEVRRLQYRILDDEARYAVARFVNLSLRLSRSPGLDP